LLKSCQRISSGPWPFETILKNKNFYGEELLAPRPTLKLEENPLLAVHNSLFSIFAAALHYLFHLQPKDMR